jgi:hypothetical protein
MKFDGPTREQTGPAPIGSRLLVVLAMAYLWTLTADTGGYGFRVYVKTTPLQIESRRACPELVERGRLRVRLVQISF